MRSLPDGVAEARRDHSVIARGPRLPKRFGHDRRASGHDGDHLDLRPRAGGLQPHHVGHQTFSRRLEQLPRRKKPAVATQDVAKYLNGKLSTTYWPRP